MENSENRASGRSTRLVDQYIQELFDKGKCTVIDHTERTQNNKYLMYRVLGRLRIEHCITESALKKVDFGKFTIQI